MSMILRNHMWYIVVDDPYIWLDWSWDILWTHTFFGITLMILLTIFLTVRCVMSRGKWIVQSYWFMSLGIGSIFSCFVFNLVMVSWDCVLFIMDITGLELWWWFHLFDWLRGYISHCSPLLCVDHHSRVETWLDLGWMVFEFICWAP